MMNGFICFMSFFFLLIVPVGSRCKNFCYSKCPPNLKKLCKCLFFQPANIGFFSEISLFFGKKYRFFYFRIAPKRFPFTSFLFLSRIWMSNPSVTTLFTFLSCFVVTSSVCISSGKNAIVLGAFA